MPETDCIVRGRRVVTPVGERPAAIHVSGGVITRVTDYDDVPSGANANVLDAGDLTVLPGLAEFSHVHEDELRQGMRELAKIGAPLFVHAELPEPLSEGEKATLGLDPRKYETYLRSRPRTAEDAAVDLVLRLAKETGARAH